LWRGWYRSGSVDAVLAESYNYRIVEFIDYCGPMASFSGHTAISSYRIAHFLVVDDPLTVRDGPFYDVAKQVFKRIPTTERRLCGARRLVTDCRRKIEMTSLCKVGVR
jgi:hypothetical protein